tara:strand:+ start:404 stop:703 length:300 start_codon:yes stop_codon:yes gene_type:complete
MSNDKTIKDPDTDETLTDDGLFDSIETAKDFNILEHVLSSSAGDLIMQGISPADQDSILEEVEELTRGYQNIFNFFQEALEDPKIRQEFIKTAQKKFKG